MKRTYILRDNRVRWIVATILVTGYVHALERINKHEKPVVQEVDNTNVFIAKESIDGESARDTQQVDTTQKRQHVIELVNKGAAYFNGHSIDAVCSKFTQSHEFVDGELFLFLFDFKGYCLAHGSENHYVWEYMFDYRDVFGVQIIQMMINKARAGGGWITYEWRGATKVTYVQAVEKNGTSYVIGSGYYPHSKQDAVINLVKGAVAVFNKAMTEGRSISEAFSPLSYPIGRFVYGDLYVFAYNAKGIVMADGSQPGLIGSDEYNLKDRNGTYVVQKMFKLLKQADSGVWITYERRNASKRTYIEKVRDRDGMEYVIGCGYHPDADRHQVISLVRRGYEYLRKSGVEEATRSFTDVNDHTYNFGDVYLVVYNLKGICLADGGNPDNVGQNYFDARDEDGRFFVQDMIHKARSGGGWINTRLKNALISYYVKMVEVGGQELVLVSGLYPVSKSETMKLLVKSAIGNLQEHTLSAAFSELVKRNGKYIKGDLEVFVFDAQGECYAYGDHRQFIWHNMMNAKDDEGRPYVKIMINSARQGPGAIQCRMNNATRIIYVENIEKDGKILTVGSSYYL